MNKTTADLIREREEAVSTARLTQDPERHLQSLEDLAEIFLRADSYLPALQNLDECIQAAERLGLGESRTATLELKAAQALIDKADAPEALRYLARARARISAETHPEMVARLQLQSARALIELSQYEEALRTCERAHTYFRDRGLTGPLAHTYNCFGRIYFRLGDLEKAKVFYEASLHLFRWDLNDDDGVIRAHNNLGILYRHLSDWRQATWHMLRSMEIATRLGNFAYLAVTYANLGIVHLKAGSWDEAREHFERALTSYLQIGRDAGVARMRIGLATIPRWGAPSLRSASTTRPSRWRARSRPRGTWSTSSSGAGRRCSPSARTCRRRPRLPTTPCSAPCGSRTPWRRPPRGGCSPRSTRSRDAMSTRTRRPGRRSVSSRRSTSGSSWRAPIESRRDG
ncbi:MAG: tetratricopeptide repeat protein [Candidatus Eisenbacteria bacterium]|uniref:Tetratricopeptide repeat protein n=1 Tax=Eiseniibacteriota bacterium TaxID=2212470 RepID=A0A538SAD9_UNCEI|nr:MAG: tetratricopeptide repeat protein [Candidatus Eisenbacteria bacterium]